ncbi:large neutral amino acids transporter [Blumeria hordei DH14]|uniref:Large neutral amino acids transporter n=1 Tax=Blumeria graminis f. sp. hordei (strain DH14) TaxID=546991 RepID=N1JJ15_BLUG1|nr:large neutral amino acids transporter [Blumeria hordei DH14]
MSRLSLPYDQVQARDSLELASLASSDIGQRSSSSASIRSNLSDSPRLSHDKDRPENSYHAGSNSKDSHGRSFSLSSAFNFSSNLFPLSSTTGNGYTPIGAPLSSSGPINLQAESLEKHKNLTYLNGLSLIVGCVIGSGVFSSPSQIIINSGSIGASLVLWLVAGLLAWTGASSYAELGGAIPLNGGSQIYLTKIFGELAGFLFTWCAVIVLKPGSTAIISIIMGEYLVRALIGSDAEIISIWVNKSVALIAMLAVTMLNCISTKLGTRTSDIFTIFKLFAISGITMTGVAVAVMRLSNSKGTISVSGSGSTGWFDGTSTSASQWAVALYAGLWAFDGWDTVREFRNPSRDLPRVIHTAMPLIITSYILVNMAYFLVLPWETLKSSNTIAVTFGGLVFGPVGSIILALIISASCFGALNASVFTSGRLICAASKEGYLPSIFGEIGIGMRENNSLHSDKRNRATQLIVRLVGDEEKGLFFTPIKAMMLNAGFTIFYIIIGEFSTLVTFYGVAGYSFYFLTVLGLIILRVREPHLERPYKTWITTPIIFCCVSLFLLSRAIFAEPFQTLIVLVFLLAGVPMYYWRVKGPNERRGVKISSRK